MEIVQEKKAKFTDYKIGNSKYRLTPPRRKFLVDLLEMSPAYRCLPSVQKQVAKRLSEMGLVRHKGFVPFLQNIRGKECTFTTLTERGELLARFIQKEK